MKPVLASACLAVLLTGCANTENQRDRVLIGAGLGATIGAVAGSTVNATLAGAALGAIGYGGGAGSG